MRKPPQLILVAVRDVTHAPRRALARAGELARATGASIELFHAITELVPAEQIRLGRDRPDAGTQMTNIAAHAQRSLARLARLSSLRGTRVVVRAEWDYPSHEAIIRRALAAGADLIVAETRHHSAAARLVLVNTDWELIRHAPCPVLLVKTARSAAGRAILVAVDPRHAHDKPAALDRVLLGTGATFADALGSPLHAFHAYLALGSQVPMSVMEPVPVWIPEDTEEHYRVQLLGTLERIAADAGIPPQRCHLSQGDVGAELAATARRLRANLVVMGAVSRSGLKRIFIGATAERAIDALPCDVLVLKPRGFRTRVPKRRLPRVAVVGPLVY